jgi:hypothetical protein
MKQEDLISVVEFCRIYSVETAFVRALQEAELIDIVAVSDDLYIRYDQLPLLERLTRFHYDLDINLEGIEVISRLLRRIDDMHGEIIALRNKVRRFERFEE